MDYDIQKFISRLETMQKNGDAWLTINAVLSLLEDCKEPVDAKSWYDLRPPMLELGRTYNTVSGKKVCMVSISNAGTEYESMVDEDGHHRYSRSHGRIIGRCTGSKNDDPLNIQFDPPPNQALAVKAENDRLLAYCKAEIARFHRELDRTGHQRHRGAADALEAVVREIGASQPPVQHKEGA